MNYAAAFNSHQMDTTEVVEGNYDTSWSAAQSILSSESDLSQLLDDASDFDFSEVS